MPSRHGQEPPSAHTNTGYHPVSFPTGAADQFTVAGISLLAYTRLAPEGGFELEARRHLGNWIRRCEAELGLED